MAQEDSNLNPKWDFGRKKDLCASQKKLNPQSQKHQELPTAQDIIKEGKFALDLGVPPVEKKNLSTQEARLEAPHAYKAIGDSIKVQHLDDGSAMVTPRVFRRGLWTQSTWQAPSQSLPVKKERCL